jgi:2-C-methyl-D-erythritol 2,4-cyclodiphosphate synthase
LGPVKARIRERLAELLEVSVDDVNIKAKTGEKVGHIGRGEAIGCQAVALIQEMVMEV